MARDNPKVDFTAISARIDKLLTHAQANERDHLVRALPTSKYNAIVSKDLSVTPEAVRQWRKGDVAIRLDRLTALCAFIAARKIEVSPEYILFGFNRDARLSDVEIRRRIADDGEEVELLAIFRACSREGKTQILKTARAYQLAYPAPAKVQDIRTARKKHP